MVTLVKEAGIPDWGGRLYQRVQTALNGVSAPSLPLATANLPTPTAGLAGRRAFVTDANATTFYSIVAAGGTNGVPVFCDGTHWRIG